MGIDSDRWPTIEIDDDDDDDDIPFYSPLNPTKVPLSPTISMMIFLGQLQRLFNDGRNTSSTHTKMHITNTRMGM